MAMAIEQRVGWGGGPGWSGIGGVSGHCQRVPLPCLGFVWGRCLSTMTCLLTSVGLSETAFSRGTSRGKTVVAETFGVLGPLLWNISYDWMLGGDLTPGRQCDLLRRRHIGDCPGSDPRSGCPSCHDSVLTWILTVAEVVGSCYRLADRAVGTPSGSMCFHEPWRAPQRGSFGGWVQCGILFWTHSRYNIYGATVSTSLTWPLGSADGSGRPLL